MIGDSCIMEKTFFADKTEYTNETTKKIINETKNSSNPEEVMTE